METRSRAAIEATIRAGVLEQNTVDLMVETGLGARLKQEGMPHHGFEFRFAGEGRRIDLFGLTEGRAVTVYPQHEVLKDLIAARLADEGIVVFDAKDVSLHDVTAAPPTSLHHGRGFGLRGGCRFHRRVRWLLRPVAGRHAGRESVPTYQRIYPFRVVRHPDRGAAVVGRVDLRPA